MNAGVLRDAFTQVCHSRVSARAFRQDEIPRNVLRRVLELTQCSPSSFNLQPYKMVVVQSAAQREALSSAMLGPGNIQRVRDAPVTVVFAADRDPAQLTRRVMKLELENGADPNYVSGLPSKVSFLLGTGVLSTAFRAVATHLLSPLAPSPKIAPSLDGWACKNAGLAAGTFLLAAQAHGLASAPMEGFDERRVGFILGVPAERYSIPLVICLGYPQQEQEQEQEQELRPIEGPPRRRFPLSEVACDDKFTSPFSAES